MTRSFLRCLLPLCLAACAVSQNESAQTFPATSAPDAGTGEEPAPDSGPEQESDGTPGDGDDGESCVGVKARAELERSPVDIIWVVDNSVSMKPAIDEVTRGINTLATRIGDSDLDYRVIMLSLRGRGAIEVAPDEPRYGVCVPAPLAGDGNCGNSERFFHSSVDVLSKQPLEQLLGTLGQTDGYREGETRGGEPWASHLRPGATKSIVVVSDDNSRLTPEQFEHFAGGANPQSGSFDLPPGLLDASWDGLFDGYVFHGLYGWGSESDPSVTCTFSNGRRPDASGTTYSTLVARTGGVRAQICAGSSAWGPFFTEIASAVESDARIACDFEIPAAPAGETLDAGRVNVQVRLPGAPAITLGKVSAGACGDEGGWYYDDEQAPSHVTLCPGSCELAQGGASSTDGGVDVEFGCATIVL